MSDPNGARYRKGDRVYSERRGEGTVRQADYDGDEWAYLVLWDDSVLSKGWLYESSLSPGHPLERLAEESA